MIVSSNSSKLWRRTSLVPFIVSFKANEKMQPKDQCSKLEDSETGSCEDNVPERWLLSRYHDESYNVKVSSAYTQVIIKQYLPYIAPQSYLLLAWNFLVIAATIFHMFQIPIAMFFTDAVYKTEFDTALGIVINYLFALVLFINLALVRPFTGYYLSGHLIRDHKTLFRKYFKLELWLNLISWMALVVYIISNNYQLIYLKVIFYFSLYNLCGTDEQICRQLELLRLRYALYKLIKLLLILNFILIWLSGIFFAIDYHFYLQRNEYYPTNLWLTNSVCSQYYGGVFINLVEAYDWYVWLNYSVYWTLQSISMVGYGDITPRNPYEVAYCDGVVLIMTLMYAFFINSTWEILAEMNETGKEGYQKTLKIYKKNYNLEDAMVNRIGSYIHDMHKYENQENTEQNISEALSDDLKNELLIMKQKGFFQGIALFEQLKLFDDSIQLFQQWALYIKESKYGQDQLLFEAGGNIRKLFSVQSGEVRMQYKNTLILKDVDRGFNFGSFYFFTQRPAHYSAVAIAYCKISELEYGNFINVLKQYSNFYETYFRIAEDMLINQRYEYAGEECWVCSSLGHPPHFCLEYFDWLFQMRNVVNSFLLQAKSIGKSKSCNRTRFSRKKLESRKNVKPAVLTAISLDKVYRFRVFRQNENI